MDRCDCKSDRPQQKKDNYAVPTTRDVPEVDKNRETLERTIRLVERYENVGESARKNPFSNAESRNEAYKILSRGREI